MVKLLEDESGLPATSIKSTTDACSRWWAQLPTVLEWASTYATCFALSLPLPFTPTNTTFYDCSNASVTAVISNLHAWQGILFTTKQLIPA